MPASLNPKLEMVALDVFPLREPVSKRAYTCLRLKTRSGAVGYGECSRISPAELSTLRGAIEGKEASSFESIRRGLTVSPAALAGLDMAMLDAGAASHMARVSTLRANTIWATNTIQAPARIVPVNSTLKIDGERLPYRVQPYSIQVFEVALK
jgi:L-alanine-DL-glutamate epimerase-like enolase superfamily enzyme